MSVIHVDEEALKTLKNALETAGQEYKSNLARLTNLIDETVSDEEGAKKFIDEIYKMNERMNIPLKLDCVKKEDIANMAKLADKEANPLYPVPVLWNEKELEKIYYQICNEQ